MLEGLEDFPTTPQLSVKESCGRKADTSIARLAFQLWSYRNAWDMQVICKMIGLLRSHVLFIAITTSHKHSGLEDVEWNAYSNSVECIDFVEVKKKEKESRI